MILMLLRRQLTRDRIGLQNLGCVNYDSREPFFATLASMIILGETLSLPKIVAAVLIMSGVFLTNYKK